jgi:hypothetical protein
VERSGNELFSAARFSFDQHRKGRGRELIHLLPELLDQHAAAEKPAFGHVDHLGALELQRAFEQCLQRIRLARLAHEVDGPERAGMPCVRLFALPGKHDDLHAGRMRNELGHEAEPLVRTMRRRRQAEIDQRERWRVVELPEQALRLAP